MEAHSHFPQCEAKFVVQGYVGRPKDDQDHIRVVCNHNSIFSLYTE